MPGRSVRRIVLVVIALLVINVPYAVNQWQLHRLGSQGVQVTATVTSASQAGDEVVVGFRLPASVDPGRTERSVRLDARAGAAAASSRRLDVRVLKGHPGILEVDGQIRSHASTYLTLGADLIVLVVIVLSWRLGGRLRRPPLVAVALGDVEDGEEGSLLDKQADGTYLINGAVAGVEGGSLLLTLRDRDVTVHLQGHHNPVDVGGQAKVLAHLVG